MTGKKQELDLTSRQILEVLPRVWDVLRCNLRAAATGKFEISLDQFHTLRHIRKGFRTVRDLADTRQVSRAAISQSVDILVRKGLVTRSQEGEDRRLVSLDLTPFAREVLDSNYEDNVAWAAARLDALSVDELRKLREAMETLRRVFASEKEER